MDAGFDAVRQGSASPLEALLTAATEMARFSATPEELANSLAYLQIDLSDEGFHKQDALARAVEAMAGGSLIGWAIHRKGKAETWVRKDLDTLLAFYRRRT